MSKSRNSIIISGFIIAFLAGTMVAVPQASAANPVLTFLEFTVIPQLEAILAAVLAIDTSFPSGTQTQIDDIETETDKIQMVKDDVGTIKTQVTNLEDTQYIPFKITGPSSTVLCAAAGGGNGGIDMRIQSTLGKDFVVTSIIWRTFVDQQSGAIRVTDLTVDGFQTGFQSGDLTGSVTPPIAIDFTQIPTLRGVGNFPDQIAVSGSIGSGDDKDIEISLLCRADLNDVNMEANFVHVSGWNLKGDTITLTAVKTF